MLPKAEEQTASMEGDDTESEHLGQQEPSNSEDAHNHDIRSKDSSSPSSDGASAGVVENITDTDHDSATGDLGSYATSTYTVGSSIEDNVEENGRTYHVYKDGSYFLPNDEVELNRLDIQHKMWLITLDEKLYLAPISSTPHNVLDLATGTGIWAIEFADAFPTATVTGTDLSLIQPSYVPPNCRFEIDDVEDEWLFGNKFDYIHGRALATCFNDGASVIKKAYDALEPGGWFELQDFEYQKSDDDSMKGTNFEAMEGHISDAMKKLGRKTWGSNVPNYARWFREAGFEEVSEKQFRWPSNPHWPKSRREKLLGAWWQVQIEAGLLESVSTRIFLNVLGWEKEELTVFLAMVRKEQKDPNIRAYTPIHVVYGRKPQTNRDEET